MAGWFLASQEDVVHVAKCLASGCGFVLLVVEIVALYSHLRVELRSPRYIPHRLVIDGLEYVDLPVLEVLVASTLLVFAAGIRVRRE
jgi:hypothetical protein